MTTLQPYTFKKDEFPENIKLFGAMLSRNNISKLLKIW